MFACMKSPNSVKYAENVTFLCFAVVMIVLVLGRTTYQSNVCGEDSGWDYIRSQKFPITLSCYGHVKAFHNLRRHLVQNLISSKKLAGNWTIWMLWRCQEFEPRMSACCGEYLCRQTIVKNTLSWIISLPAFLLFETKFSTKWRRDQWTPYAWL